MLEVARRTGRTFVEPCVRDGRIVPCIPGRVRAVSAGLPPAAQISAARDPLLLPSLSACTGPAVAPGWQRGRKKGRRRRGRRGRRGRLRGGRRRRSEGAEDAPRSPSPRPPPPLEPGWAYPLRAYFDVTALRQLHRPWISFEQWWAIEGAAGTGAARTASGERILLPHAYCVGKTGEDAACTNGLAADALLPWAFTARFSDWELPRGGGGGGGGAPAPAPAPAPGDDAPEGGRPETQHLRANLPRLKADASRTLVLFNVWRGCVDPVDTYAALPPFHPAHAAGVRAWLASAIAPEPGLPSAAGRGRGRYAVWQWRSEGVRQDGHFRACAMRMAEVAKEAMRPLKRDRARAALLFQEGNASRPLGIGRAQSVRGFDRRGQGPPTPRVAVLVADIPAPANSCRLWGVYAASHAEAARFGLAKLLAPTVGMLKYDEEHLGVDAGVLAIRDFIIAVEADWYVTCKGRTASECYGCTRAISYFTRKIVEARAAASRKSFVNWFHVTADMLV